MRAIVSAPGPRVLRRIERWRAGDQFVYEFDFGDSEGPIPKNPGLKDLPPLEPWWGPRKR